VRRFRAQPGAEKRRVRGALDDDQRIAREILCRDEPRRGGAPAQAADAKPAALADRVALEAAVASDHVAIDGFDRPGEPRQPVADEVGEWPLADEADTGRIVLAGDRKPAVARDRPDLGLPYCADRKLAGRELLAVERMQEVALVLAGIDGAQEPWARTDARVMAGRETLGAEAARVCERGAELDLAIAEHVRVRRAARLQLGQEVREHPLAVFRGEADLVQRDVEFGADSARILEVRRGRAVTIVVLQPVRHEKRLDLAAGLQQEMRRDRRVHAAGQRHDRARHARHHCAAAGIAAGTCASSSSG
jgi:hypothetical protein